jgi:GT2 family glycosyltransferase
MNISVVIPNYNGEKIIEKHLTSVIKALQSYKEGKKEIIVSDDSSEDNSVQIVERFMAGNHSGIGIKLLISKAGRNLGFSSNVNRGVSEAEGDILVLLNTDVIPSEKFIQPLLEHFGDPEVFAVGCMDESVEEGAVVKRGRGVGKFEKGFLHHSLGSLDKEDTLWVSGGSGAFRKKVWNELGGLDPLFNPFYWEDIDISYRALKAGYKLVFEKRSVVRHEHEKGSIKKQYGSNRVQRISYRNQILFVWLNITDYNLLTSHFVWLPYNIFLTLLKGDTGLLFGLIYAIMSLPGVISHRSKRKKMFHTSDHHILLPFEEKPND